MVPVDRSIQILIEKFGSTAMSKIELQPGIVGAQADCPVKTLDSLLIIFRSTVSMNNTEYPVGIGKIGIQTKNRFTLVDGVIVFTGVPPDYSIVSIFWSFFAIAIRLPFCRSDGAGHRYRETQQCHPSPAVQQVLFQADPYSTISAFCKYDNN